MPDQDKDPSPKPPAILYRSEKMRQVLEQIDCLAPTDCSVLITGETGTGKDLAARVLHAKSQRAQKPLVVLNCGALPESLLEAELFGHEKGAFTGAVAMRPGAFETADGGTVFLDEIGEASPPLQVKLLRVLEDGSFRRVGGQKPLHTNVRLLSATHRDLAQAVKEGRFREDLYFRLSAPELFIPPLRERRDDQLLLTQHFLAYFAEKHNRLYAGEPPSLSRDVQRLLDEHPFPGNVRELQKVISAAVAQCRGGVIEIEHLPRELRRESASSGTSKPPLFPTPPEVLASRQRPPPPRDPSYAPVQRRSLVDQIWNSALRPKRVATLLQTYRGGGRSLARQVAAHSGDVPQAWLTTEAISDRCSDAEFFSALSRQPDVRSQLDLRRWLGAQVRDRALLIVLLGTRGPEHLLEQTAEALRSMQASAGGILLLAVGGERLLRLRQDKNYSWLRLLPASSLFDVPALTLAEVSSLLSLHRLPAQHAQTLWHCSGGHPWLLYELVQSRLFDPDAATAHLQYLLQMDRKLDRHLADPRAREIMRSLACDSSVASPCDNSVASAHAPATAPVRDHAVAAPHDTTTAAAPARPLAALANPLVRHEPSQYAEARLYFDGFLTYTPSEPTKLRCPAIQALFRRNLSD